ncbi:hypothetical protein HDU92_006926 [Lobulomyces angularis]|nr:hypothetical protein HDU92_006926 [Lobulomyces angularis]
MEANYLRQSVGPVLADAFASLYAHGIDSHNDPTHPHKDPIGFVGRYLLEHDRVQKESALAILKKQPLLELQKLLAEKKVEYSFIRNQTYNELKRTLEERETRKEEEKKRLEDELQEKLRLETEETIRNLTAPKEDTEEKETIEVKDIKENKDIEEEDEEEEGLNEKEELVEDSLAENPSIEDQPVEIQDNETGAD